MGIFEPKFSPKLLSELRLDKRDHTVIQLDALKPDNSVSKFRKRKRKSLTKREIRHFHIVVVQWWRRKSRFFVHFMYKKTNARAKLLFCQWDLETHHKCFQEFTTLKKKNESKRTFQLLNSLATYYIIIPGHLKSLWLP